ncbi:MAG: DUF6356 family protein [Rickettsiales bacterium]
MKPEYKEKAQEVAQKVSAKLNEAFTEHPKATGETYLEHLWFTLRMSGRMLWAGIAILLHGIFPFLFTKTGSNEITALYAIMKNRIPASKLLETYEQHHGAGI